MHLTSKLKGTLFAATLVAASAFSTGIVPNTFCISEAQAQEDLLLNPDKLATKGNLDAIVTIIEFSDFQCPFSSRVNPTLEQVLQKYPKEVRIAYAPLPLGFHENARPAAKAAYAAQRQGKFWEMHDILFANQNALSTEFYLKTAQNLGLDLDQFQRDMDSDKAEIFIDNAAKIATSNDIQGTPSFLINGTLLVGAHPIDGFTKVIDQEIERANKLAKSKKLSGKALYQELVNAVPKTAPKDEEKDEADTKRVYIETGKSPVKGPASAPITIVEFTDYECPFCSRGDNTIKELMKNNPGQIRLVHKNYPLPFHRNARLAHQAAIAAGKQGKFWEMHDLLFANQKNLDRDSLIQYAQNLKLNTTTFIKDMDSKSTDTQIEDDIKLGGASGVHGTPHYVINGKAFSGAQPLANFQKAINDELYIAKTYSQKGLKGDKLYKEIVKKENRTPTKAPEEAPLVVDIGDSPVKGLSNAKVTVAIFADFQCSFSQRIQGTLRKILNNSLYSNEIVKNG